MEFGTEKGTMKNEKWNCLIRKKIRTFGEKENCEYFRILEAGNIKQTDERKRSSSKEWKTSQKQTLCQKSHQRNKYLGCLACIICSGLFLNWIKEELRNMDKWTIKLVMVHKTLHLRDGMDKLYVTGNKGGKELTRIEYCVHRAI